VALQELLRRTVGEKEAMRRQGVVRERRKHVGARSSGRENDPELPRGVLSQFRVRAPERVFRFECDQSARRRSPVVDRRGRRRGVRLRRGGDGAVAEGGARGRDRRFAKAANNASLSLALTGALKQE